jgi:nucleotide-binding universal stress UspA family protein
MAIATPAITYDATTPADQIPNPEFGAPASATAVERTAAALRGKGHVVHVVDSAAEARDLIVGLLPEGAEVSQGASETLEDIGVTAELESGRYDNVRSRTRAMDRSTPEGIRAMRKLGVGPDYYVNSAQAVTEGGSIVIASNTGSQLAPLAFGAGQVIFAIGTQKIVPDLETAMRRLEQRSLPLENARMQKLYGVNSHIRKILIINGESRAERITVVLIKEPVGA